ncbi:MAG: type II toxin-antitoxin system HicB family antitoxin [Candidatus Thorarchaeota archaeon]|nr:type II toxin-antitoxin system HicB family antitoxin [Candidatus Thorarchaeota archaeon]
MTTIRLTAIVWREDDTYVSKCPEIEVASAGDTPEEALENLREAAELWLVNARALGIMDEYMPVISSTEKTTTCIEVKM